MTKILAKSAKAGFEEKNDLVVEVSPLQNGSGVVIDLQSPVKNQYGRHIEALIKDTVTAEGFFDVQVNVLDKGAWDYTIKARTIAALERGMKQ
ncbi:citrate lyase acyl carrier protein [Pectinatus cerevisiiphilus]|uniref:Citrate lyase subunit gamma (Acyl carrier protein) n=1 Tax=Pectinatus cerevisiiphilus TaxID=86956 RepID=A0A4R3KEC9_9FIRM|nr:citrate lyase acyl carrier protein [Pectinatus cerevisiiphilus]TCS81433.1 citrate lyase subunit gamma (acyl carrier protein) [Pectinatus cerevisiiphilus]